MVLGSVQKTGSPFGPATYIIYSERNFPYDASANLLPTSEYGVRFLVFMVKNLTNCLTRPDEFALPLYEHRVQTKRINLKTALNGATTSQVEVIATRIMAYAVRVIAMETQEEVYSGSDQTPVWRELAIVSARRGINHA